MAELSPDVPTAPSLSRVLSDPLPEHHPAHWSRASGRADNSGERKDTSIVMRGINFFLVVSQYNEGDGGHLIAVILSAPKQHRTEVSGSG